MVLGNFSEPPCPPLDARGDATSMNMYSNKEYKDAAHLKETRIITSISSEALKNHGMDKWTK